MFALADNALERILGVELRNCLFFDAHKPRMENIFLRWEAKLWKESIMTVAARFLFQTIHVL